MDIPSTSRQGIDSDASETSALFLGHKCTKGECDHYSPSKEDLNVHLQSCPGLSKKTRRREDVDEFENAKVPVKKRKQLNDLFFKISFNVLISFKKLKFLLNNPLLTQIFLFQKKIQFFRVNILCFHRVPLPKYSVHVRRWKKLAFAASP